MMTASEMCEAALKEINVTAYDEDAQAEDLLAGLKNLNEMLLSWQGTVEFLTQQGTLTLTTDYTYTLADRPVRIVAVRRVKNDQSIPMTRMGREAYFRLPNRTTKGTPNQYYFEKNAADGVLSIWPSLATADGTVLEYIYEPEFTELGINGNVPIPNTWQLAAKLKLADSLQGQYQKQDQVLTQRAEHEYRKARALDAPTSLSFRA